MLCFNGGEGGGGGLLLCIHAPHVCMSDSFFNCL